MQQSSIPFRVLNTSQIPLLSFSVLSIIQIGLIAVKPFLEIPDPHRGS